MPNEVHESRYDETRTVSGVTYWNGGLLSPTANPWGTTQHDFDANDNKVRDTWVIGGHTFAITHTIDAGGWLIAKSWSDGDSVGSVANPWTYDTDGRLLAMPGHITSAAYNARGQVTAVTYANGVTTTNTYNDARGWLARVLTVKAGTTLQDVTFVRDAAGKITTATSAGRPNDSWTYSYDTLDRLVVASNAADSALSQTFGYDSAHNMVSNSQVGAYSYPAQGRSILARCCGAGAPDRIERRDPPACSARCDPVRASAHRSGVQTKNHAGRPLCAAIRRRRQHDAQARRPVLALSLRRRRRHDAISRSSGRPTTS